MSKTIKILIFCACFSTFINAQVKAYPIDGWHSKIEFSVKFGGLLPIKGQFDKIKGTILIDESNMTNTSSTIYIDTNSINTGLEMRDKHLKGKDFFDVKNHPKIYFSSKKTIEKNGQLIMLGDVHIHDVSKQIEVPIKLLHGEQLDLWKNYRVTLTGEFEINRLDFDVGENQKGIGEKVWITFMISARVFNTETIALFKRQFGEKMINSITNGQKKDALEQFNKLSEVNNKDVQNPSNFEFLYLYLKQNNYNKASNDIAELYVELFPEESEAHSLLGNTYFEKDDYRKAITSYKKALVYDDENTLAKEMLKLIDTLTKSKE